MKTIYFDRNIGVNVSLNFAINTNRDETTFDVN